MCRQLVFESVTVQASVDPFLTMLQFVRDSTRGPDGSFEESLDEDWKVAAQAAADHWSITAEHLRKGMPHIYLESIWQAHAAMRLHAIGRSDTRVPIDRYLSPSRHDAIVRHIEKLASHLGGNAIAEYLFRELAPTYDAEQERYHFVNVFGGPTLSSPGPRLPANYILQLAGKFALPKKPVAAGDEAWARFRQACIDYAVTYEVQPTSAISLMHVPSARAHSEFLTQLALHDALFSLHQVRSSDVGRIGHGLLKALRSTNELRDQTDEMAKQVLAISEGLLTAAKGRLGPVIFSLADIERAVPELEPQIVRTLVEERLSHRMRGGRASANSRFKHPWDVPDRNAPAHLRSGADLSDKPLIQIGRNRYLLLDRSSCTVAFLTVFMSVLGVFKNSNAIGDALEAFVLEEFESRGFHPKFGRYKTPDGGNSDCDVVLECDEAVIFIEIKKKGLTASARAGLDIDVLSDIAKSLVKATLQSGNHEYRLRQFGSLRLSPKSRPGVHFDLDLNGREILRLAVSLPDYGAFQDQTIPETLLAHHTETTFSLSERAKADPGMVELIEEINKQATSLKKLKERMFKQANEPERWLNYRHCMFISMPQFLLLADGANSVSDLWKELKAIRGVLRGSRDLYFELHSHREMFPPPRNFKRSD